MSVPRFVGAALLAGLLGVSFACVRQGGTGSNAQSKDAFGSLTVDQVQALLAGNEASVFDNNTESRYQKSHLPGAKWLAASDVKPGDLPADKNRTLVFYCANEH